MSINWQWSDKMGVATYQDGWKTNLYRGNAFTIAVNEFENNTYSMNWFAVDVNHLKNMLGLTKGYIACFQSFGIVELELDTNYKETAQFVQLLAKAKINIKITLYKGEKNNG